RSSISSTKTTPRISSPSMGRAWLTCVVGTIGSRPTQTPCTGSLRSARKSSSRCTASSFDQETAAMDEEVKQEHRMHDRLEKLGTNEPRCGCCGETDWRCFELHHIAGKRFDEATVRLCRNCHAKASDSQRDHPARLG